MPATIWLGGWMDGSAVVVGRGVYRCAEAQLQQCVSGLGVFHYANVRLRRPLQSPTTRTPTPTQLLSPSLNTEPQIGWDSLLEESNHKPHGYSDVMRWRNACHTRHQTLRSYTFLQFLG